MPIIPGPDMIFNKGLPTSVEFQMTYEFPRNVLRHARRVEQTSLQGWMESPANPKRSRTELK